MSKPIKHLISSISEKMAEDAEFAFIGLSDMAGRGNSRGLESPIERIFDVAIWMYARHASPYFRDIGSNEKADNEELLVVEHQVQILDYRVDFLIYPAVKGVRAIVVECDGHDFHERTKEQAERDRSRDRRLQEAGYVVFRFTGREIYRDPFKCAEQVGEMAFQMLTDWSQEA
jgi:very-short-patch-repair endonuclease